MQLMFLLTLAAATVLRGSRQTVGQLDLQKHEADALEARFGVSFHDEVERIEAATPKGLSLMVTKVKDTVEAKPIETAIGAMVHLIVVGAIWMYACKGQSRTTEKTTPPLEAGNVCRCLSAPQPKACCETICAWEFMWAETVSKLPFIGLTFYAAMGIVAVCLILAPFTAGASMLLFFGARCYTRGAMRDTHTGNSSTGGERCTDCLAVTCCAPCAAYQEAEFAEVHEAKLLQ